MQVSYDQVKTATVQMAGLTPVGCVAGAFTIPSSAHGVPVFLREDFHIQFSDDSPLTRVFNAKECATILTGAIMAELHEKGCIVTNYGHRWELRQPNGRVGGEFLGASSHTHPFDALIDLYVQYRKSIDKPKFELMPNLYSVWRWETLERVVTGRSEKGVTYVMAEGCGNSSPNQAEWNSIKGVCIYAGVGGTEMRWTK